MFVGVFGRAHVAWAFHSLPSARRLSLATAAAPPPAIDVKQLLRTAQAVCFDVDSTVIADEGIDVLAAFKGRGEEVAALTASAMGGAMLFRDALQLRLDIIRPSRREIEACLAQHPPRLSEGVQEMVALLQARGTHVYLVSGGFRQMINPVADMLMYSTTYCRIYSVTFTLPLA